MKNFYYLVVSSKDSIQYFPNNQANYFTTLLSTPLDLDGSWNIGLKEIFFEINDSSTGLPIVDKWLMFDVFLPQTSGCVLGGVESMLLRRFFYHLSKNEKTIAISFDSVNMMPIKSSYFDKIEIIIKPVDETALVSVNEQVTAHATLVLEKSVNN